MKKVVVSLALIIASALSHAQVLKNNFLNGCKEGQPIEKASYSDKKSPINKETWSGAFNAKSPYIGDSPIAGKELTYDGYKEQGLSIVLGGLPKEAKARPSMYGLESTKKYTTGTYYLSFLANFSQINSKQADFICMSNDYVNAGSLAFILACKSPQKDKIQFGVGIYKTREIIPQDYDLKTTHLIILKLDYDKKQASIFIDPQLKGKEPKPNAQVISEGSISAIKAIALKNSKNYSGNIGNFRFADSWKEIIKK
ncbi:MAG: hypothetical protein ACK5LF_15910 [Bacteroides xylanisolvens]